MVEIEVIQLPTGTKLFKNSANDAIATVDEHGYFTFQLCKQAKAHQRNLSHHYDGRRHTQKRLTIKQG